MSVAAPFPTQRARDPRRDGSPATHLRVVPSRVTAPALKLTRRGHLVLFLTSCLLLLGAIIVSGGVADAAVAPSRQPATAVVTVNEGDSLWSIARRIAPREDPRGVVMRIRDLNGLSVTGLMPGQRLVVPS
jgi:hypothetical protein